MNNKLTTTAPKQSPFRRSIANNIRANEAKLKETDPLSVPNRLGMIFDDSGSMGNGPDSKLEHAKTAVKNFTASCNMFDTSIAIYPLNLDGKPLTIDYDLLNLYVNGIACTGYTPLYSKLDELISRENITRAVVFSDGGPTDGRLVVVEDGENTQQNSKTKRALEVITKYTTKEISIDTIYIGMEYGDSKSDGYLEMEEIAKVTKGIFIHFKDATSLSKNLKYLAPKYRTLLLNTNLKEKVEKGETI